jgi:hypothetical protein
VRVAVFIHAFGARDLRKNVLDRISDAVMREVEEIFIFDDRSRSDEDLLGGPAGERGGARITVHRVPFNPGNGGSQKLAFRYALDRGFDFVIMMRGDGDFSPEALPAFIGKARERKPAAVIGSRMMGPRSALRAGMPLYKFTGNKILTAFENLLLGTRLSEFHSGFRMYSMEAVRRLHFDSYSEGFTFDTLILLELRHHGCEIDQVPIPTYIRSEIGFASGLRVARDVVASVLHYRLFRAGLMACDWIGEPGRHLRPYRPKRGAFSSHRQIVREVVPGTRVLDLGAEGLYADQLRAMGCTLVGVNRHRPGPEVDGLYDRYLVRDLDLDGLPKPEEIGRFGCILMADILDHLSTGREVLSTAKGLLDREGVLVVSIANVAHWWVRFGLLLGRFNYRQRGLLDRTHLHLYTRRTFRDLISGQGYRIIRERVTPVPFELLAGTSRLSRMLCAAAEYAYYPMALFWRGLFAYQYILVATIPPGARAGGPEAGG